MNPPSLSVAQVDHPDRAWTATRNTGATAALALTLATLVTPATFSIAIYEFHPEALAAPLLLLLYWISFFRKAGRTMRDPYARPPQHSSMTIDHSLPPQNRSVARDIIRRLGRS